MYVEVYRDKITRYTLGGVTLHQRQPQERIVAADNPKRRQCEQGRQSSWNLVCGWWGVCGAFFVLSSSPVISFLPKILIESLSMTWIVDASVTGNKYRSKRSSLSWWVPYKWRCFLVRVVEKTDQAAVFSFPQWYLTIITLIPAVFNIYDE